MNDVIKLFSTLPTDVKKDVKETLSAYNRVSVTFENSKYKVSPNICLSSSYSNDYKFIGEFKATDIFNDEERIHNYITNFCNSKFTDYNISTAKCQLNIN